MERFIKRKTKEPEDGLELNFYDFRLLGSLLLIGSVLIGLLRLADHFSQLFCVLILIFVLILIDDLRFSMNLLLSGLAALGQHSMRDFMRKTNQADVVQERFLRSLLHHHQHTEVGRLFGLAEIRTIDQFRDRVPILPYSSYEPYVERMAKGETNILTPDPVIFFNLTSGSTGKRKLIPITKRSRQIVARANSIAIGFATAAARRRHIPLGKILYTSPTTLLGYTDSGIPYGPNSTSDLRLMGSLYRSVFAFPFEALQVADTTARHYLCLLFALRQPDVGMIAATFPVLALRLANYLEQYGEDLVNDLQRGTIAPWLKLEPHLRAKLERQWTAAPQRATELWQVLRTEGRLTPYRAFPRLAFMITARGGTSDFYFERYPEYFGDTPIFGGTYASAECVFGVHRDFGTDGVILAVENGFYEFVPEDQWEVAQPKTLLPGEVVPGQRYRILVTNYNGFYRYDIGDVVEVEGFYNQAPIFVFRYRRGGLLSSTTEKTTEYHAVKTMQILQQMFNLSLENFCITLAEDTIPAAYLVNIELAAGSSLTDPVAFLQQFDRTLKEVHTSYEVKRRDQVPPPRLRILAPGSFAQVRDRLIQRGATDTQLKFPNISEDRTLLAGLPIEQEVRLEQPAPVA